MDISDPAVWLAAKKATEWTVTLPTEPGWYWATETPGAEVGILFVTKDAYDDLVAYDWRCISYRLSDLSHWLGPLPVPAPPTEHSP